MLVYLSIIGIFLSMLLLYFNARKFLATVYLGAFFLLLSLYGINQYILLQSRSVFLISIITTNVAFLYYLIGPMLYWYVRSVLTDTSRLKKRDLLHLIPMLVYLLSALPYILTPYSYKVEIATEIVKDISFLGRYNFTVLSEVFSNTLVYLSRPFLLLVYTFWSIGLVIRYFVRRADLLVFSRQNFMFKWIFVLLAFQLVLISSYLTSIFLSFTESSDVLFTVNYLQILSATGMIGLLITPFLFPAILYGLPRIPEVTVMIKQENEEMTPLLVDAKKQVFTFETEYTESILQKADLCMKEHKPYLQPEFNLTQFSVLIKVPAHHLAFFFREVRKQTFSDYRNEWRINHSKALIREGKASGITLEAIGLQSGFATRNTFLTAFKKAEGVSPSIYVARISD